MLIVMAILRRNTSEKRAFELVTRGFDFSAEDAKEMGLVNHVYAEAELETKADEFAGEYSKVSASAVRLSKQLLYQMDGKNFFEAVDAGAIMNAKARMTEDCKQGVSRFLEKK